MISSLLSKQTPHSSSHFLNLAPSKQNEKKMKGFTTSISSAPSWFPSPHTFHSIHALPNPRPCSTIDCHPLWQMRLTPAHILLQVSPCPPPVHRTDSLQGLFREECIPHRAIYEYGRANLLASPPRLKCRDNCGSFTAARSSHLICADDEVIMSCHLFPRISLFDPSLPLPLIFKSWKFWCNDKQTIWNPSTDLHSKF